MSASPPSELIARAEASIEAWKRRLLDLSLRNRALNLKAGGPTAPVCEGLGPVQAVRQLLVEEQPLSFVPARTTEGETVSDTSALVADLAGTGGDVSASTAGHGDVRPHEPETDGKPTEQASLRHLRVPLTRQALDSTLRKLDDAAARARDDQGLGILFLCLSLVEWIDPRQPGTPLLAPLLLLPVQLERKSAGGGYVLHASQEDPFVNPTLAEALRQHHRLELPQLPEDWDDPPGEGLDPLESWFAEVRRRLGTLEHGRLDERVILTTLSFAKYVMYRDLETLAPGLADHPLVSRLFQRKVEEIAGLPATIRDLDLDKDHPPEATAQIVDADGSQLRAVAAVDRGHDLVLEGPPGTGKSQTITNLVATVLAKGGRVLFVAEKKAALDVVHAKLTEAGLGECCLELHAAKATRRAVLASIGEALDLSLAQPDADPRSGEALAEVRARLSAYIEALHTPDPEDGLSPRQWIDRLEPVRRAPRVLLTGESSRWSDTLWRETLRALEALGQTGRELGSVSGHPWRGCGLTLLTEDRSLHIDDACSRLRQVL
ncbi:MAG: DUF4011 domain-containing protein, partial [Candidatus Sericytochromatia bacterium]|nr:DUF4011 domain-containing protein [Candidatus Sericytochromatia bacterium]